MGFPRTHLLTAVEGWGRPQHPPLPRPSGALVSDDRPAGQEEHGSSETQMPQVAGEHCQERGPAPAGGCEETGPPLWALACWSF